MAPTPQDSNVSASLTKLSINNPKSSAKLAPPKKAKKAVADSWEDEDLSESEPEPEPKSETNHKDDEDDDRPSTSKQPVAPPPTPLSPAGATWPPFTDTTSSSSSSGPAETSRRPEKTDAVARRMIAASLGLKAPKQTEEQRAYQDSIREQEKKRREQEKGAEQKAREDVEKAKAAMWDD